MGGWRGQLNGHDPAGSDRKNSLVGVSTIDRDVSTDEKAAVTTVEDAEHLTDGQDCPPKWAFPSPPWTTSPH